MNFRKSPNCFLPPSPNFLCFRICCCKFSVNSSILANTTPPLTWQQKSLRIFLILWKHQQFSNHEDIQYPIIHFFVSFVFYLFSEHTIEYWNLPKPEGTIRFQMLKTSLFVWALGPFWRCGGRRKGGWCWWRDSCCLGKVETASTVHCSILLFQCKAQLLVKIQCTNTDKR